MSKDDKYGRTRVRTGETKGSRMVVPVLES
jgi:hypothetical protein